MNCKPFVALRPFRPLAVLAALLGVAVLTILAFHLGPGDDESAFEPWRADKVRHSRLPGDGLPPRAPDQHFFNERAFPAGVIPIERWQAAQLAASELRDEARAEAVRRAEAGLRTETWEPAGPTNIGGRITDLVVDPTDANIVYAGAAEGGVLRTTDGGQSWTPLFDDQPSLAIGAVAIDPSDPSVVYAGTGEVNPGGGSVAYGGAGVFRSVDQGESWEPLGLENTGSIGRIVIDPADSQRIFVAAMGRLWVNNPERGVYRTTDGGATWDRVLHVSDSTGCVDLIMRPDDTDVILAAMWQRVRRPEYYDYGGPTCAVYKSTDGGDSWSLVGGGLPSPGANSGRIGLSLCASQPDVMHAVYADRTGYFAGLYESTNGGQSWTRTNDGALGDVFASYGWWFGNVRTHPINPDWIYVLGLPFYRSTNGGQSYYDASDNMHVDHHGLAFGPGPNPVIYNGNDGGVYRSTDGGSAWTKLPDLPILQVYRVALDAGNPDAIYCGSQDNGTCRTLTGALNDWQGIFGGDGFQPLVHPNDSNRIWAQYQYGSLYYSSNGGYNWSYAQNGIGYSDRRNWNSPLVQDPTHADTRYFGTQKLYRNSGNTSWTAVSGDLTGGPHLGNSGQVNGILTTIGVSPLDGQIIWTGSDDGYVQVTTDGCASWSDVSDGLPERWITSVRPDPFDTQTAYVTVSGWRWGEPLPHVYRTSDVGSTWQPIAGNLPEAPVNDLLADPVYPDRLVVATDVGVYQTTDGGAHWSMLGADLPRVVVTSLALEPVTRELHAGTYGRSMFVCTLGDLSEIDPEGELTAGPAAPGLIGRLDSCRPNPARTQTRISWELRAPARIEVEVFTVSGRRIWGRQLDPAAAGFGFADWDLRDQQGHPVPTGAYFAQAHADGRPIGARTIIVQR